VPRAYEDERGLQRQKMIERGPSKKKNGEKGAYKSQNERNRLSKKICFANIKKGPRAYESLNPAQSTVRKIWLKP
jgi:hypothetical protein